jgi:hypothetical protein
MLPHAHHREFGDSRFGQRGQHGRGNSSGSPLRIGLARLVNLDTMARLGQAPSQQAPHQASTQHHAMRTLNHHEASVSG